MIWALNGRWWPGRKWPMHQFEPFEVAPADLSQRLQALPSLEAALAARELRNMVERTYELVGAHLEGVDVDRLRRIFRFSRQPPPGGAPSA
jgi:hypothetical protein